MLKFALIILMMFGLVGTADAQYNHKPYPYSNYGQYNRYRYGYYNGYVVPTYTYGNPYNGLPNAYNPYGVGGTYNPYGYPNPYLPYNYGYSPGFYGVYNFGFFWR